MESLIDLTHHIETLDSWLERDMKIFSGLSLREWAYIQKKMNVKDMEDVKCFLCKRMDPSVALRQAPSITRCADELVESHQLCDQCCSR